MLPMGFEHGWSRRLDVVIGDDAREPNRFDLSPFVTEVNALKQTLPALNPIVAIRGRCAIHCPTVPARLGKRL